MERGDTTLELRNNPKALPPTISPFVYLDYIPPPDHPCDAFVLRDEKVKEKYITYSQDALFLTS